MTASELPMFPLGTNVFPLEVMPLQIFEPRYVQLLGAVRERPEADFGIVLIDRGSEVGGGDVRTMVGTRMVLMEAQEAAPERWLIAAAGVERIDVIEWLDDDPFPRAAVRARSRADNGGDLDTAEMAVRESIVVSLEIAGVDEVPELVFSDDPTERLDQLSAIAPLSAFDRQRVLEASTTREQIEALNSLVQDKLALLRATRDAR